MDYPGQVVTAGGRRRPIFHPPPRDSSATCYKVIILVVAALSLMWSFGFFCSSLRDAVLLEENRPLSIGAAIGNLIASVAHVIGLLGAHNESPGLLKAYAIYLIVCCFIGLAFLIWTIVIKHLILAASFAFGLLFVTGLACMSWSLANIYKEEKAAYRPQEV